MTRIIIPLLIICTAMLVGCKQQQVEEYVLAVPADADAVVAVRFDHIVTKASFANSLMFKMELGALKNSPALGGAGEALAQFASDPSVSGIDFECPAYIFKRGDCYGMTLKVDDESLLDVFVGNMVGKGICTKTHERNNMTWTTVAGEATMVWDDGTLLLVYPANNKMAEVYMKRDFDSSFASTDAFNDMNGRIGDDICLYANAAVADDNIKEQLKDMMPAGAKWSDIELTAGIDFATGQASIDAMLTSRNVKVQEQMERFYSALKPIGSNMTNSVPRQTTIWALMGADGSRLPEMLKSIPGMKEQLLAIGLGIDIEQMMRAVNGDLMVAVTMTDSSSEHAGTPDCKIYAQLANTDFMADVDYWKQSAHDYGIDFVAMGNNHYRIHADEIDAYWAVDGHTLYLGTEAYQPLKVEGKNSFANQMAGACIFVMADASTLVPEMSTITFSSAQCGEVKVNVNMKNQNENILKQLPAIILSTLADM